MPRDHDALDRRQALVDVLAHGVRLVLQQLELGADVDLAVLTKTLEAVARGRDKIQGRRAVEELAHIDLPSLDEEQEQQESGSATDGGTARG